jgi:hypothetical protein
MLILKYNILQMQMKRKIDSLDADIWLVKSFEKQKIRMPIPWHLARFYVMSKCSFSLHLFIINKSNFAKTYCQFETLKSMFSSCKRCLYQIFFNIFNHCKVRETSAWLAHIWVTLHVNPNVGAWEGIHR